MIEAYTVEQIIALILALLGVTGTILALARAAARERQQLEAIQRQHVQEYGHGREHQQERQQERQAEPDHEASRSADDDYAPRVMHATAARTQERVQERGCERGGLER